MEEQKPTEEVVKPVVVENVAPTAKPELTEEQKTKMKEQQQFFFRMRQAGAFLKFIYNDIERQKSENLNRAQRRRFEKELKKGRFSRELVDVYLGHVTEIEAYIEEQLNPKPKAPEVDGAEFYKALKEKEARGEVIEEPKA